MNYYREVYIRLTVMAEGRIICDVGPVELEYLLTIGPVEVLQWGRYGKGNWANEGEEHRMILDMLAYHKK